MRRRGWIRSIFAVALAALIAGAFAVSQTMRAEDPTAEAIRKGLITFGQSIDRLAQDPVLNGDIPLSQLNPVGDLGLVLDKLFEKAFEKIDAASASVDELIAKLESQLDATIEGVQFIAGCNVGEDPAKCTEVFKTLLPDGSIVITLPLRAQREVGTPLAFDTSILDLNGGSILAKIAANATLKFKSIPR